MPIASSNIHFRLSGGVSNAIDASSLGGVKSSNDMSTAIFDDVTSAQASAGLTEYRCLYVFNDHSTLTLIDAVVWFGSNTANTRIAMGLGSAATNATEQTVANEATAPTGVAFSTAPINYATGLLVGSLPPGQGKSIWLRRVVMPGATLASDTFSLTARGDTNP